MQPDVLLSQFGTSLLFRVQFRCFLTCIQVLRRQVRCSGIPISWRVFHSLLWSTQSKTSAQSRKHNWNCFFRTLLLFQCSKFWALLCQHVRWLQLCSSLNILWHFLSLGLEWKLTFSSPVVIAEFCKFAGTLSAALSQHHLLGSEVTQLEFHHLH